MKIQCEIPKKDNVHKYIRLLNYKHKMLKCTQTKVHLVTLHIDCRHFLPLSTCPERGLDLSLKQFKYFQPLSTCPERGLELSLQQFKYFQPLSTCPERGLELSLNNSNISSPSLLLQLLFYRKSLSSIDMSLSRLATSSSSSART